MERGASLPNSDWKRKFFSWTVLESRDFFLDTEQEGGAFSELWLSGGLSPATLVSASHGSEVFLDVCPKGERKKVFLNIFLEFSKSHKAICTFCCTVRYYSLLLLNAPKFGQVVQMLTFSYFNGFFRTIFVWNKIKISVLCNRSALPWHSTNNHSFNSDAFYCSSQFFRSGTGSGLDSDSIRSVNPDLESESGSGSNREKITHKKEKS